MKKIACFVLITVFSVSSFAGVLNFPGNSVTTEHTGTAGGFTAIGGKGASAVLLNPAALTTVEELAWELGAVALYLDFDYDRHELLGGGSFDACNEFLPVPYGAFAYRFGDFVFAVGTYTPYGLEVDYGDDLGFDSQMSFTDVVAGFGYEVNEYLSLGTSFKAIYADIGMEMPLIAGGQYLGQSKSSASGWGYGYSMGTRLQLDPFVFGLTYEPVTKVKVEGHSDLPPAIGVASDSFSSHVYSPERIGIGVSWQAVEKLNIGASYFRTDYGKNRQATFDYDLLPNNTLILGWDVVNSVHLGAEYELSDQWMLRVGGTWMSKGTPDYSPPSIPDGDGWIASAGFSRQISECTFLDVGLGYFWADRHIDASRRNIAAGDISMEGFVIGAGLRQGF